MCVCICLLLDITILPLFPLLIADDDTDKGDANYGSTGDGSREISSRQDDTEADDTGHEEASKVDTPTDNIEDGEDHTSPPSQPGLLISTYDGNLID